MKTLKRDGINGALLLQTLAYIETHTSDWNQHEWRCGTGMCFAGHAVVTLGDARPVAPMTKTLAKLIAQGDQDWTSLSAEEKERILDFGDASVYVRPEPGLDEPATTTKYRGRNHKAVMISDRAETLLGKNAIYRPGYNLFGGKNRLPSLRRHVAKVLEITEEELGVQLRKIAKRNRWEFPTTSRWRV